MEIAKMTFEETETRLAEIKELMEQPEANLEELRKEVEEIETRRNEIAKAEEERKALAQRIATGEEPTTIIKTFPQEGRGTMDIKELRNSKAYIDAFAEYIKNGDETELRALLTENVEGGTIAVPDFVYDEVKTAWDNNEIMSLVEKAEIAGNLKVNFEISGTDAVIHTEGSGAVSEEELIEGIVTIVPQNVKKWISISDEVMSLRGRKFLEYIYRELAHKIVKKMADALVAKIATLPQVATATSPSADKIESAPLVGTVAEAIGHLSDEASNATIVMNKLTWSEFKKAQYANGFAVDPFEGLSVKFNNSLPSYASASAGDVYMVVGDFGQGALANFPNGETIEYKFDELSRKKEDLVEVLGKEFVGLGVVADKAFTLVAKPVSA